MYSTLRRTIMLKKGIIDEELKALSGRVFSQKSYYLADELVSIMINPKQHCK